MTAMEKEKKQIIKEQDIIELLARIYSRKRFIICFTLISFVVGIILAFTSIKQYTEKTIIRGKKSIMHKIENTISSSLLTASCNPSIASACSTLLKGAEYLLIL
jgi:LPS O-antigen subunit length determinant protein (WzzB/FepE family)